MTAADRPLRADARRNREKILASAGELFARRGSDAQMDEIAEHSGVGLGTVYRHFPTKQALLAAIIGHRFEQLTALAHRVEQIEKAGEAFEALLLGCLGAAESDSILQFALLGSEGRPWGNIEAQKTEFHGIVTRIIDRAILVGHLRSDLTVADFPVLVTGLMSTMYFHPSPTADWRRHLTLLLDGIRARP